MKPSTKGILLGKIIMTILLGAIHQPSCSTGFPVQDPRNTCIQRFKLPGFTAGSLFWFTPIFFSRCQNYKVCDEYHGISLFLGNEMESFQCLGAKENNPEDSCFAWIFSGFAIFMALFLGSFLLYLFGGLTMMDKPPPVFF